MRRLPLVALVAVVASCGDDGESARTAYFALDGSVTEPATFWDSPFPSDLRLAANGAPDITGFPNKRDLPILNGLLSGVADRRGWPVMAIAYFRFTAPVPEQLIDNVIAPSADAVALLIDIDPTSPERGTRYPIVARSLPIDPYVTSDVVAFAPRPGIVLRAKTRYAYVIRTGFAPGFTPPAGIRALAAGHTPPGDWGAAAQALYAPLWDTLDAAAIDRADVLVATVFTTGDEVARNRARSEAIRAAYHPAITDLTLVAGATHDGFCEVHGSITMPQFQHGVAPWHTDGKFILDANDVPMRQTDMAIPFAITLPKSTMPVAGWPLYQFFHGSGGISTGLVDLGYSPDAGDHPEAGKGPGYVVAMHGIASASSAFPLNPERFPQASDYEYLNISNLAALPFTFQQGVFEQRMFLDALLTLQIPAALLQACGGAAPPGGVHKFDPTKIVAGGQSMGGMYMNMISPLEPRYGALVPTGAGGFWNLMILKTELVPGALELLSTALGVDPEQLTFVHPTLDALAMGWEIAEPLAYMARIARRPLDGIPPRHVYEPVPKGDENFSIEIYDAAALAYGNQQAGDVVWPSMQDALGTDGISGVAGYPVKANRSGLTRVVVQFEGDGLIDPHYIYRQLETVKHQYGCFFASYLRDGVPTVPAPGALTDPCP